MKKRLLKMISKGVVVILASVLMVPLLPVRVYGQFGGIVFEPSSYAALGRIWSSDISMYAKMIQEFNQLVKIYTTGMQLYRMSVAMSQMISHPQRMAMLATGPQLLNNITQNRYGETIMWPNSMNGNMNFSRNAWTASTLPLAPNPYLAAERLGSSILLAKLASVEATDGASTKCMQVLSNYRGTQGSNQNPIAALKTAGVDVTPAINAMVAQLNLSNAGAQQLRAEQQSQGSIQACLAEQQMLANKYQRDNQVEDLNFIGKVQTYNQAENDDWTDGSTAFQSFRLP